MARRTRKAGAAARNDYDKALFEAIRRFFTYSAALPPDEYVNDFLRLIEPERVLRASRRWVADAAKPAMAGLFAEVEQCAAVGGARQADLIALAAYALAKTGYVARADARPGAERLVALLFAHVRAARLAIEAGRGSDPSFLLGQMLLLVAAWPGTTPQITEVEAGRLLEAFRSLPRPRRKPFFPTAVPLASGNAAIDGLYHVLEESGHAVAEPFGLLCALLDAKGRRKAVWPFGRRLFSEVCLTALGYEERKQEGFHATLRVERWPSRLHGTQIIRHPDALLIPSDTSFDDAVALAGRVSTRAISSRSERQAGQTLRWSLRRDDMPEELLFASGGSIAGAFAVAFRLVQTRAGYLRLVFPCAIVSALSENGALVAVDPRTLRDKIEASAKEDVLLAVEQETSPTLLKRNRRRLHKTRDVASAVRHCLNQVAMTLVRQYRAGLCVLFAAASVLAVLGTHFAKLASRYYGREFDASEEFSISQNPDPYSVWRYGWAQNSPLPNPQKFLPLERPGSAIVDLVSGNGLYSWGSGRNQRPYITFNRYPRAISMPEALVLWPAHALAFGPMRTNDDPCLRFVAPRDGTYRVIVQYAGASIVSYQAVVYLFENNRLVCSRRSELNSVIRRDNAFKYTIRCADPRSFQHTAYLRSGQTIDVFVGPPLTGLTDKTELVTGIRCHITRID